MRVIIKLFSLFVLISCSHDLLAQAIIRGNIQPHEDWSDTVYVKKITDFTSAFSGITGADVGSFVLDSSGVFEFVLSDLPCTDCLYRIHVAPKGIPNAANFIFSLSPKETFVLFEVRANSTLDITGQIDQLTKSHQISTSSSIWTFENLRDIREPLHEVFELAQKVLEENADDSAARDSIFSNVVIPHVIEVSESINPRLREYMSSSNNIYDKVIGSLIYDYDQNIENDREVFQELLDQLSELHYDDHTFYSQFRGMIEEQAIIAEYLSSETPNLSLPDINRDKIDLFDVGQNLILLDFWASWCSPCRRENRLVVKPLYEKYKDKGFEVYGVSLDTDRASWMKAIEKDGISWVHVSDLIGMRSPAAFAYSVNALPTTFLIDKSTNVIVAQDLHGDELVSFLEEYFEGR